MATSVFRGQGRYKVDAKGRVSIPAAFRRVLEANDPDWTDGLSPNLVIHYGPARRMGCIECYTMVAAADVDARIAAMKRGSPERRAMETYFQGMSMPASVDDTGRILLPQALRDMIGITDEATFVAAGDTFKIWAPEKFEGEVMAQTDAILAALPDDVDPLVLLDGGPL